MVSEGSDSQLENHLREKRQAMALSQKKLADLAGITRQAVSALEAGQYSPATSVALQLARALRCRVEDLFCLKSNGEIIYGELIGTLPLQANRPLRAQVLEIGQRVLVRPLDGLSELTSLSSTADGLIVEAPTGADRVKVRLLRDRGEIKRKIVVGGCDPAMFLAGEYTRTQNHESVVPCLMGSSLALSALKRGEVHVAGIHLAEEQADHWQLPDLKEKLGDLDFMVVTFAHWEEGFIIAQGNPKQILCASDIARPNVTIVNRELGSGARRLLDKQLSDNAIPASQVRGYRDEVLSHLDVAARIRAGLADAGIGVRAAAFITGLDFVPLQRERYDLVIPKEYFHSSSGMQWLLDLMVSKPFRDELEALGGYDTREMGRVVELPV